MKINYLEPTKEQIIDYLEGKQLETKEVNGQVVTNKCPFCNDNKVDWTHFYISPSNGMFKCHKCGKRGNLITLAKHFGDYDTKNLGTSGNNKLSMPVKSPEELKKEPPKVLEEPQDDKLKLMGQSTEVYHETLIKGENEKPNTLAKKVFDYLTIERGFTVDTLKHFKIGWTGQAISIPYLDKGKVVNIRFRKNPFDNSKKFAKMYSTPGGKMTLFNCDVIDKEKRIAITEGEFDAMSLYQQGWGNVVSISCGANTFKEEWVEMLKKQAKIYLCYDNDVVGNEGVKVAIDRLGAGRCYKITLPRNTQETKKDLNDFFAKDKKTIDDFHELFNKAEKVTVDYENIKHIKELSERVKEEMQYSGILRGLSTGYSLLDKVWAGMRPGNLIVISGDTNIGKSFFTQNIILNMARQDITCLSISLEETVEETVERFLMLDKGFNYQEEKIKGEKQAIKKLDLAFEGLANNPIYMYSGYDQLSPKLLGEIVEKGVKDFGCEIAVIDHLHYFVGGDRRQRTIEIGDIVRYVKLLARKLNIPIILICHLRKLKEAGDVATLDDLKDSSSIKQDADIVGLLYRERDDKTRLLSSKVTVNTDKNRHGKLGKVDFIFGDGEIASNGVPLCVFEEVGYTDNEADNANRQKVNATKAQNEFKGVNEAKLNV